MVEKELTSKGIKVIKKEEEHDKEDKNVKEKVILAQDVEVGKKLAKGDTITLTIPVFVVTYPDFVKEVYTVEEAEKFCEENGCTLVKKEKESSTDKAGSIIYQSRTAGTKVVKGVSITITVAKAPENVAVTEISLDKTSVTLSVGEKYTLTPNFKPLNASNKSVTWSTSSNNGVIKVESGTVTALTPGNAVVTATSVEGGKTASATITVTAPTTNTATTNP